MKQLMSRWAVVFVLVVLAGVARAACDPATLRVGDAPYWRHKSTPDQEPFVYRGTSVPGRIMRIQVALQARQVYVFSLCAADGGSTFGGGGDAVLHLCRSTNGVPAEVLARGDNECGSGPRLAYEAPVTGPVWVVITAKDCESFGDGVFALAYWRESCVKELQAAADTAVVAITDAAGYGGTGTLVARDDGRFVPYVLSCDSQHSGAWNWGRSKVKITFHDGTVRWAEHVANDGGLGLWKLESGSLFRRYDYSRYTFCGWKRRLAETEPAMVHHYTRVLNNPGNPVARQYGGTGVLSKAGSVAVYDGPGKGEWLGSGASGAAHREPGTGRVLAVTEAIGGGNMGWMCEGRFPLQDRVLTAPLGNAFSEDDQLGAGDSAGRKGGSY